MRRRRIITFLLVENGPVILQTAGELSSFASELAASLGEGFRFRLPGHGVHSGEAWNAACERRGSVANLRIKRCADGPKYLKARVAG